MRASQIFATIAVAGLSLNAHALMGTQAIQGAPEAVCRVMITIEGQSLPRVCSGTLVAADQVLTAAHCVSSLSADAKSASAVSASTLRVECGYQGADTSKLKLARGTMQGQELVYYLEGLIFRETHTVSEITLANGYPTAPLCYNERCAPNDYLHDLAWLTLKERSKITPIEPNILAQQKDLTDLECRTAGFGAAAHGTVAGVPYDAAVSDPLDFSAGKVRATHAGEMTVAMVELAQGHYRKNELAAHVSVLDQSEQFAQLLAPGDSGGPLYCRKDRSSKWQLAGVNAHLHVSCKGWDNKPICAETQVKETDSWTTFEARP